MPAGPRIVLAPTWEVARLVRADVTVEAEYGSNVAIGRVATAAHHQPTGPYSGASPAPCNDARLSGLGPIDSILVSHLDLDTIGGCLRASGDDSLFGPEFGSFWALAEQVDVRGRHRLPEIEADGHDVWRLLAFSVHLGEVLGRLRARAGTSGVGGAGPLDVTDAVQACAQALRRVLTDAAYAEQIGRTEAAAQDALDRTTFVRMDGPVVVRIVPRRGLFVNHLYRDGAAVVSFNLESGAITVSTATPGPLDCRDLVQGLWGTEAGGHAGIAGSPRGRPMGVADLEAAVLAARAALEPR